MLRRIVGLDGNGTLGRWVLLECGHSKDVQGLVNAAAPGPEAPGQ